ncbi:MAG: sulfatase-like hydrolase/transferase [Candidatus Omnitrophica bacterium]|nr:sulfatase-like hydrolase/transferase [Candidatus Omnitrophota bacterium]
MKKVNSFVAAFLVLAAVFLYIRFVIYGAPRRPDIILITAHTLRPDHLSTYGYERIDTAAIDSLASKSTVSERAYCTTPIPAYGYASIITGRIPAFAVTQKDNKVLMNDSVKNLAERLSLEGYSTALIAADPSLLPLSGDYAKGFDIFLHSSSKLSEKDSASKNRILTDNALKTLKKLKRKGKPVFAWISYSLPIYPYDVPASFQKAKEEFPYDRQVLFLDEELSRLLNGLRRLRMVKSSLIIMTSATGESLGEHKEILHGIFLYDATTRVPLMFKLPKLSVGRKIKTISSHVDIAPTVLEVAGAKYDKNDFDGQSLLAQDGNGKTADRRLYLEATNSYNTFGWSPLAGMVWDRYKYMEAPQPELYDISLDQHELKNIIDDKPEKASAIRQELLKMIKERRPQLLEIMGKGPDPKSKADILIPYFVAARYLKEMNPELLIGLHEKLLEKDPTNKAMLFTLARICDAAGRPYSAQNYLVKLTALYEDFAPAWGFLGDIYNKQGKIEEAIRCYEKAVSISPDTPAALNNLAWLYAEKGENLQRALNYAERANELVKDHPSFIDTLAEIHIKMGNPAKGTELLRKALSLDPKSEYIKKRLGELETKK